MSDSLGLSIGVANLVAVHSGREPVRRSSVLTLFEQRPTEIGLPEENPNLSEPGLVLRGFVERVGDRAPLVAADGTKYLGEVLTVEAIEAMARTVGYGQPITIAVPAYWSDTQFTALREEFFAQPDLARDGVAPVLVSDATAALAALRGTPGFPTDGVIALCDFGASGTTVTLVDASSSFTHLGRSARYTDFSGDAIDKLLLDHVQASDRTMADLAGSGRIASQARLLGECRRAKERLSTDAVTTVALAADDQVQLSRAEFEQLIGPVLDGLLDFVAEALQRNGIKDLAAVATVGGGASIPLVSTRLSERFGVPVHTAAQPAFSAAIGAAALEGQGPAGGALPGGPLAAAGAPTTAAPAVDLPTAMVPAGAIDMTQAARAAQATDVDGALAWSEDADDSDEPVPYTGRDATGEYADEASHFDYPPDDRRYDGDGGLPWYKRTALVLGVAGAVLAVLVALALAINVLLTDNHPATPPAPSQTPPQTPQTVTVTGPDNTTTVTVIPAPAPSSEPTATTTAAPPAPTTPPPSTTTTTTEPATTTAQVTTTASPVPPPPRDRPLFPRLEPPWRR